VIAGRRRKGSLMPGKLFWPMRLGLACITVPYQAPHCAGFGRPWPNLIQGGGAFERDIS